MIEVLVVERRRVVVGIVIHDVIDVAVIDVREERHAAEMAEEV